MFLILWIIFWFVAGLPSFGFFSWWFVSLVICVFILFIAGD